MRVQTLTIALLSIIAGATAQGNPCDGLWFGQLVPDPTNCRAFYVCVLLVPIPGTCDDGSYFNAERAACVVGECDDTTVTETSTWPTTVIENYDQYCVNVFFGARPYESNNGAFVGCIRGQGWLYSCLNEEIFDPSINECKIPIIPTAETTFFPPTQPIEGLCFGEGNNKVPHPDREACELYIQCINGEEGPVTQCPFNFIFSRAEQRCVPGSWATCTVEGLTTTETSTLSTLTTSTAWTTDLTVSTETEPPSSSPPSSSPPSSSPTAPADNPCEDMPNLTRFADENSEDCKDYIQCMNGQPFAMRCNDGQVFSDDAGRCVNGDSC